MNPAPLKISLFSLCLCSICLLGSMGILGCSNNSGSTSSGRLDASGTKADATSQGSGGIVSHGGTAGRGGTSGEASGSAGTGGSTSGTGGTVTATGGRAASGGAASVNGGAGGTPGVGGSAGALGETTGGSGGKTGATDGGSSDTDGGNSDGGPGSTDGGSGDKAGATDGGAGGKDGDSGDGASGSADGGSGSTDGGSLGGSVSCAGYPVWNSKVTYNTPGQLVEYNCKLYTDQGFAYGINPETNNGQYYQWLLTGSCRESSCAMGEGPWIACGNYDHWTSGTYEVFNDVWGGGAGPQCITAWDGSHWTLQTTQPATSGVKSYPNSGFVNLGKTISSLGTFTSSFDVTVPSDGDWEATYDIWVPTEIMIWMYTVGNVGPIATSWDSSGKPIPSATDVTVGGHTWNVYHQNGGSNVISFVRTTNTTAATVDVLALLNWARTQSWIPDGTIGAAQFGFEISGTNNVATDFTCNRFSLTVN